nr:recombinase family protein [Streptacidiphilus albus]
MNKRSAAPGRVKRGGLLRVVIYLRVSTEQQAKGYGLKVQDKQCRAWLNYKIGKGNYSIVKVFHDDGVSGKLASRPDFDLMNDLVRTGGADIVVFGKLDRIGRTMMDIHRWVYDTTEIGVRIATADGRIDSTDEMFGITLSLLAYMAELEHTLILERTSAGREQKLLAGGWPFGAPPYGIQLEGKGKNAVPVLSEYETEVLQEAANLLVDEKLTRDDAAAKLNVLLYKTPTGKDWTGDNLGQRLKSTALDGYAEFKLTRTAENDDEEDAVEVFRIPVPMPLPAERVVQLRAALNTRSFKKVNRNNVYMLSGRMDSFCESYYTGGKAGDAASAYYRCMGSRNGKACTCSELPTTAVESAVWAEVETLLSDGSKFESLIEDWMGGTPERIASYERRIAHIDRELAKAADSKKDQLLSLLSQLAAADDDDFDLETIASLKADLKDKNREDVKALREERERVTQWLKEANDQTERAREILTATREAAPRLATFTTDQKSDLIDLLDVRVTVTGKGVPMRKGLADPLTEWHRRTRRPVPVGITDEEWARVSALLPASRQMSNTREVFEAILHKLRTAERWTEVLVSTGTWSAVYRRAKAWYSSGAWEAALDALGVYEGAQVPALMVLPPMVVTGSIDPKFTALVSELEADCNHNHIREQASPRSSSSGCSSR